MFFLHHAPELIRIILNASNVTARILSIAVLILSLAPLGSMYVLFFSVGGTYYETGKDYGAGSSDDMQALAATLRNPNATLEELWSAFFAQHGGGAGAAGGGGPPMPLAAVIAAALQNNRHLHGDDHAFLLLPASQLHHWRILLPWVLSLVLGVLVPCLLSVATLLRRRRLYQQRRAPPQLSPEQEKRLLRKLKLGLQPYSMELKQEDRAVESVAQPRSVTDHDNGLISSAPTRSGDEDDGEVSKWWIPAPGIRIDDDAPSPTTTTTTTSSDQNTESSVESRHQRRRLVVGTCGICLDSFVAASFAGTKTDDDSKRRKDCTATTPTASSTAISWSSNPDCVHCFHTSCIMSWLVRTYKIRRQQRASKHPCPCCRQSFLLRLPKPGAANTASTEDGGWL